MPGIAVPKSRSNEAAADKTVRVLSDSSVSVSTVATVEATAEDRAGREAMDRINRSIKEGEAYVARLRAGTLPPVTDEEARRLEGIEKMGEMTREEAKRESRRLAQGLAKDS